MGELSKVQIAALIALLSTAAFNPLVAGSAAMIQTAVVTYLITIIGAVTIIAIYKGYDVDITAGSMTIRLIKKTYKK